MSGAYDDILYLPHHISPKRKRMSMTDRAAQFSPFAALTGYDASIQEMRRITDTFIDLSEDKTEALNAQLQQLAEGEAKHPQITVTYFLPDERKSGGAYRSHTGFVKKLDSYEKTIVFSDGTVIPFSRIYGIDNGEA